jgi:hypothetical protein
LFHLEVGCARAAGFSRLEERQALERRIREAIAFLHADVQVLVRGLADLHADPAAHAEVAAREAHERAHRRVLRVEVDVSLEARH